jgi:hypothetical protein
MIELNENSEFKRIPPFPIKCPSIDDAKSSFEGLKSLDGSSLIKSGNWNSKSEFSNKLDLYIPIDSVGMEASNHFAHPIRMACDSNTSASPIRSWFNPKIHASVASSIYYEKSHKSALALRKYIASQFRPSAAKAIFQYFGAQKVFDPCSGWGDRLVAALSLPSITHYHGRDVNPLLFSVYSMLCEEFDDTKKASFELTPSELSYPCESYFDLVFTSPPYWIVEKYYGEGQSWKEYKKFDDWLDKFLFRMLDNSWMALADEGHMVINISDCYAHHTMNRICQPMIDYCVDKLDNCSYVGAIGYSLAQRPNNKNGYSGVHAEPIFVFKKGKGYK